MRRLRNKSRLYKKAYMNGFSDGSKSQQVSVLPEDAKRLLRTGWSRWILEKNIKRMPWKTYHTLAAAYRDGFCRAFGLSKTDWVVIPTEKTVAVIVCVRNEEETIPKLLHELKRLSPDEIIFIVNGSTDQSFATIRALSDAIIVHYRFPLGYDVGRAIGAQIARSDILLFIDSDIPIQAEHLVPFIYAVEKGLEIGRAHV